MGIAILPQSRPGCGGSENSVWQDNPMKSSQDWLLATQQSLNRLILRRTIISVATLEELYRKQHFQEQQITALKRQVEIQARFIDGSERLVTTIHEAGEAARDEAGVYKLLDIGQPLLAQPVDEDSASNHFSRVSAELVSYLPETQSTLRSIIIGGPYRTGKSTIGRLCAMQLGFLYLPFDGLSCLWINQNEPYRELIQLALLDAILSRYNTGAVIEGGIVFDPTYSWGSRLHYIRDRLPADIIILGNQTADVSSKASAFATYRATGSCYTIHGPDWGSDIDQAERHIALSARFAAFAKDNDLIYYDLDPNTFHRSMTRVSRAIIDHVSATAQ